MVSVSGFLALRLSKLIVDTDLDMKGFRIVNLGPPAQPTDAARWDDVRFMVEAHANASPIAHPDGSVTRAKLEKTLLALILQYL